MNYWEMGAVTPLCLALCATAARAEGLTLVHDGASDYAVVIRVDASPSERWAAEELVDHIRQMSGATLTVRRGQPVPAKAIVLGFDSPAEALGVTADDSLGDEGYVLAKRGPGSVTWRLAEAKAGPMDMGQIAAGYRQVLKERGYAQARPASELGPPFTDWLSDYAALVADRGLPVPPELREADPRTYRLVQACQMDGSAACWQRADGASDGWCEVLEGPTFGVQRGLMAGEEYVRRRRYKVYARIQGQGSFGRGTACIARVSSADGRDRKTDHRLWASQMSMGLTAEEAARETSTTRTITGEELADGEFHVVEIADVTDPTLFTMNVAAGQAATAKVLLDCFWLQEVPPAP